MFLILSALPIIIHQTVHTMKTTPNNVIYFLQQNDPLLVGRVQSLMLYILYTLSVYVLINDFLYHRESTFLSMRTTRSNH